MQAVVLIGGLGTRLRALYPELPKCLVPVLGKPYLNRLFDWLYARDVDAIHLACGYRAHDVESWLTRQPPHPSVTLSVEPEPRGTGGGLKFVEAFVRDDPFLVLNGDSFMPNLDLRTLVKSHRGGLTLAVTRIEAAGRFGTVEFEPDGRITAFLEKADRAAGWVNGGVYVANRSLLNRIPAGRAVSLETELFPALAAEGKMRAVPAAAPLLDIGTPDGLAAAERYFQSLEKS